MKTKKTLIINIALSILIASIIFILSEKGFFTRLELTNLDYSFRLKGPSYYSPRIMIVEITDADILKIGRWPWQRSWHGTIAKALADLGAKSTYFDIVFSEPSTPEDDKLFEEALAAARNVYLPYVYQSRSRKDFDARSALRPIKEFSSRMKGTGATNVFPDDDGIIRKIPLVFPEKEGGLAPHMALELSRDYLGLDISENRDSAHFSLRSTGKNGRCPIPLLENYQMMINWPGRWRDTFVHHSFLEVLSAYKDFLDGNKPAIDIEDFKGSICLVGITAIGLHDIKAVPIEPAYPGIGIMAAAINTILGRNFLAASPRWLNILIFYLLSLLPAFLIHGRKPLRETVFIFLISVFYWGLFFYLFTKGFVLQLAIPLIGFFAAYITVETYNFIFTSIERQKFFKMSMTDNLTGLYNILHFKTVLKDEIGRSRLHSHTTFAVAMVDIDHFKRFNDRYGHQVGDLVLKGVADILKSSVRSLDVVARYGGEEMIILVRGADTDAGVRLAEKIRNNVKEYAVKHENKSLNVTVSLGVAEYKAGDTVDSVIKKADEALYMAKSGGRNRVCR